MDKKEQVVLQSIYKLKKMKSYHTKDAMHELKIICDYSFDVREKIGVTLVEKKAAGLFVNILKECFKHGFIENDSILHPADYAVDAVINFSDGSNEFATSLGLEGMVKLCVDILGSSAYQQKNHKSE
ncbi:uncharacterized protein LOC117117292, partial [Anneissia japonica]|uniref:uncharacterized protein LOC117117292 n=1 Tax=Anneissia japonica TaxID=1529436 RepID=UPI00142554C9